MPAIDHLRWKLLGRAELLPWQIVGEDAGKIVGLSAIFRQLLHMQGRLRDAYQVVDVAVLPEYQDRGVTTAARRLAVSDRIPNLGVYINTGSTPGSREQFRRTRRWNPVRRKSASVDALVLEGPVAPRPSGERPWTIATPARFDERLHDFAAAATAPYDMIDAHNAELLNWRYCDPRAGRWTLHTAEENGRILGYITYRISHGRGLVGGLLALPGRLDVVESLLAATLSGLQQQGIATLQCWTAPRHPYRSLLQDFGIDKKRRTVTFVISAEGEEFGFLEQPGAALHLVAGDTDLV